jgi:hypothetical protein
MMEQQLETLRAEGAVVAKQQEEATLKMLSGMVEKVKAKRGAMKKADQQAGWALYYAVTTHHVSTQSQSSTS